MFAYNCQVAKDIYSFTVRNLKWLFYFKYVKVMSTCS